MATSKKKGIKSSAQDNFLAPYTPTIDSVTDVGTGRAYNDGAVSVAFTAQGPYAATSYTVVASTGQTATGSSSPIVITGIATGATPTVTIKATNANGESATSGATGPVTVTTVPATPSAPTVSTAAVGGSAAQGSANTANDTVSWTAPATGGKTITNYYWVSSDGKTGNTTSTSVVVPQESGTAQTYTVRADNGNGSSVTSPASASITSAFSFTPFGFVPFGFSPFGFSPFGFSPVVFGFSPFGFSPVVFGFSPVVFGFSPVVFGFSPVVFGFSPSPSCIDQDTLIAVVSASETVEYKAAKHISVGDKVWSSTWDELIDESFATPQDAATPQLSNLARVQTEIVSIQPSVKSTTIYFNGDLTKRFSLEENILVKRDNMFSFISTVQVVVGDKFMNVDSEGNYSELSVTAIDYIDEDRTVYRFDAEPTDNLIAANLVVHNGKTFF